MKRIILTIIAAAFLLTAKAQKGDNIQKGDGFITSVEKAPEFPGGLAEFYKYVMNTMRYPDDARTNHVQGDVTVTMMVEKDGSLSNIKVLWGVSPSLNKEAVRILSVSPKWNPGMQNGHAVRMSHTALIIFKLG